MIIIIVVACTLRETAGPSVRLFFCSRFVVETGFTYEVNRTHRMKYRIACRRRINRRRTHSGSHGSCITTHNMEWIILLYYERRFIHLEYFLVLDSKFLIEFILRKQSTSVQYECRECIYISRFYHKLYCIRWSISFYLFFLAFHLFIQYLCMNILCVCIWNGCLCLWSFLWIWW